MPSLGKRSRTLPSIPTNKAHLTLDLPPPKRARTSLSPFPDDPNANKENIPPSPRPLTPTPVISIHDEPEVDQGRVTRSRTRSREQPAPAPRAAIRRTATVPARTPSTRRPEALTVPVLAPTPPLTPSSDTDLSIDTPLLTPSLDMNRLQLGDEPFKVPMLTATNAYAAVKGALKASQDGPLTAREAERAEVRTFLQPFLTSTPAEGLGKGKAMYVSGTPGTGKTAVIRGILSEIERDCWDVKVGMVNCMGLTSAKAVWDACWFALSGVKVKDSKAALEQLFIEGDCHYVLALDEIDALLHVPSVLCSILTMPQHHPTLCLLTIANSLSLPSQLPPSLALTHVSFAPYAWEQMTAIVRCKLSALLSDTVVLDSKALELAARRVGGRTGDLRVLVEVLRKALDAAEREWTKRSAENPFVACDLVKVGPAHIVAAIKAVSFPSNSKGGATAASTATVTASSPTTTLIRTLPIHTRLILLALLVTSYRACLGLSFLPNAGSASTSPTKSGKSAAHPTPSQLLAAHTALLAKYGASLPPSLGSADFHDVLNMLEASSLVSLSSPSSTGARKRTTLERAVKFVPAEDDVRRAMYLMDDQHEQSVQGPEAEMRKVWSRACRDARNELVRRGKKAEREAQECPMEERL